MKTRNLLLIGMGIGLGLFGLFEFLSVDFTDGGIISAIIVGILIGMIIDKHPVKYAFFSICVYNLIVFILTFIITKDGNLVLREGGPALLLFIGFFLLLTLFNSIIGSFGAFVTYNMISKQS